MSLKVPKITVAVVSARSNLIKQCVENLINQSLPADEYRIIIVAEYSSTQNYNANVKFIADAPKSIAKKRNMALFESDTEYIAFIDDDCIADKEWLKKGLKYMETHPDQTGVQGRIIIPETDKNNPNYNHAKRLSKPLYQTSNIFYRKNDAVKFGGFDERFAFQREDVDFAFTLIENGFNIGYEPDAIVSHPVREKEYWDLIKTAWRKRYDPLLAKKHPKLFYTHFKRIIPGTFALMSFLWIFFAVVIIFPFINPFTGLIILLSGSLTLTLLRIKDIKFSLLWFITSFLSFLIAPLVALLAVLIGDIKSIFR